MASRAQIFSSWFPPRWLGLAVLVLAAAAPPVAPADGTAEELVVIVGPASGLRDVSRLFLRRVFRGELTASEGVRLVPLNLPPRSPPRVRFDQLVLELSPEEMGRYWVDQKLRGAGNPPRSIDNPALLVKVVAAYPGAIAYVPRRFATPAVRILRIDGRGPGDSGYLLAGARP
jgi:hypothetical protein